MDQNILDQLAQEDPKGLTDELLLEVFQHVTGKKFVKTSHRFVNGKSEVLWIFDDTLGFYSRLAMENTLIELTFDRFMGEDADKDHFGDGEKDGESGEDGDTSSK